MTKPDANPLEGLFVREYGLLLTSTQVAHLLGYKNINALAKARERGVLPIRMFLIPNRRGWFATTIDAAACLTRLTRLQNDMLRQAPEEAGPQRPRKKKISS